MLSQSRSLPFVPVLETECTFKWLDVAYQQGDLGLLSLKADFPLALRRFLPRYGFPIGLQSLTVQPERDNSKIVRLERDGILAISEYVPGSDVLAGGMTYTSRAVLSYWEKDSKDQNFGDRLWQYACAGGHSWTNRSPDTGDRCAYPECGGCERTKEKRY